MLRSITEQNVRISFRCYQKGRNAEFTNGRGGYRVIEDIREYHKLDVCVPPIIIPNKGIRANIKAPLPRNPIPTRTVSIAIRDQKQE